MTTIISFLIVLGIIILTHEFGHYLAARACNVKVLRFCVGFGPILWKRHWGSDQTEWALALLPLGGYVKMLDARSEDMSIVSAANMPREFTQQPVFKRMVIVAAGPLVNLVLACGIFFGLYVYGMEKTALFVQEPSVDSVAWQAGVRGGDKLAAIDGRAVFDWEDVQRALDQAAAQQSTMSVTIVDMQGRMKMATLPLQQYAQQDPETLGLHAQAAPAVIAEVLAGGAAEKAGLRAGDRLVRMNEVAIADAQVAHDVVSRSAGTLLHVTVQRGNQMLQVDMKPAVKYTAQGSIGQLDVRMPRTRHAHVKLPAGQAMLKAVMTTWSMTMETVKGIGALFTSTAAWKDVGGPVSIAQYAGQSAQVGVATLFYFIAVLSVGIGVLNLLPIPILDGGHLVLYSIEAVMRRPLSEKVMTYVQTTGAVVMAAWMLVALSNDIMKLLR